MPKAAVKRLVRFRMHFTPDCSVWPGKIDLLETIERTGSLQRASRELGMSYAYGWLLLNDLNRSFDLTFDSRQLRALDGLRFAPRLPASFERRLGNPGKPR